MPSPFDFGFESPRVGGEEGTGMGKKSKNGFKLEMLPNEMDLGEELKVVQGSDYSSGSEKLKSGHRLEFSNNINSQNNRLKR